MKYDKNFHITKVFEYASKGYTQEDICTIFKISREAFNEWTHKYPEFRISYKKGVNECVDDVESVLVSMCQEKDLRAVSLYLKAHSPKYHKTIGDVDKSDTIQINIDKDDKCL